MIPVPFLGGSVHVVVLIAGAACLMSLVLLVAVLFVMLAFGRREDHA